MRYSAFLLWPVWLCAAVLGAVAVSADPLDEASDLVRDGVEKGAASQRAINRIDDETRRLREERRALLARVESLETYLRQLRALIDDQQGAIERYRDGIARARDMEREILPLAERMVGALDEFVRLDVPFLPGERGARVERLKAMLPKSGLSASEKFRRILEAYGIEADYGRTIEARRGELGAPEGGGGQVVDFLRVGRNILVYQTLDGGRLGVWDSAAKSWRPLGDEYRPAVRRGLRMARETVSPGLLVLPVRAAGMRDEGVRDEGARNGEAAQ